MPQPQWPELNSGHLRHPITIYTKAFSSPPEYDASGAIQSRTVFTTAMASIEPMRGTDVVRSGQDTTQLFLTITMRYQPGVEANMEVQTPDGDVFIIQAIENVLRRNVVLKLLCLGLGKNW